MNRPLGVQFVTESLHSGELSALGAEWEQHFGFAERELPVPGHDAREFVPAEFCFAEDGTSTHAARCFAGERQSEERGSVAFGVGQEYFAGQKTVGLMG